MEHKNPIDLVAMILVIIGGLNWLLIGALSFNLVEFLFGALPILQRIVYILVGISAIYMLVKLFK